MTFISLALILFLIMDPVGNISAVLSLLRTLSPSRRHWVIIREMFFALLAMLFFYIVGDWLLELLQVSEVTARLASGIILFLLAIKILFLSPTGLRANLKMNEEPFLVPLAIPLIAGPGLLATIMLYSFSDDLSPYLLPAILIAWFAALITLLLAKQIHSILGNNGLNACERLMGMILVLLGIQRFLEGIQLFILGHTT